MAEILLRSHGARRARAVFPSRDEVMRWVLVDASGHWFWKASEQGEKHRRIDHNGQAIWSWRSPKDKYSSSRVIYVVARLLLQHDRGPFPARTSFRSLCGLAQCVNPAHWEPLARPTLYHLLQHAEGWLVHRVRTTLPISTEVIVQVRVRDVVHVARLPAEHFNSVSTLCGAQVYPADVVIQPTGSIVTCKAGC